MAIRHRIMQNIPEIWRKERLSILLQRKLEIMTLETETMKVLVINASANKERSTTLKLTKTFLEGLGIESTQVEFVTTIGLHINPCRKTML